MLITNGIVTRNIEAKQLPEYTAKGYKPVEGKPATKPAPKKAGAKDG